MILRLGSLCTGYAGLDEAICTILGAAPAWHADNDPDVAKLLACRFPGVPNHGDITAADWTAAEPVDVVTAGFPCQDVSVAGKRAGLMEGNRTGLWLEIVRAITVLQPKLVFLENVGGILHGKWTEEPNDRCVCGWPYRRRGLHHGLEEQGLLLAEDRCGDDDEGVGAPGDAPVGVRRRDRIAPSGDRPLGGGASLVRHWDSGRLRTEASAPALGAQAGAGRTGIEGGGDSGGTSFGALDGRGAGPLRTPPPAGEGAEPQGSSRDTGSGAWDAVCLSCGRDMGHGTTRLVFRSGVSVVLRDLAEIGFDAVWTCLRASDIGAPHRRERIFILAWPADTPHHRLQRRGGHGDGGPDLRTVIAGLAAHTQGNRRHQGRPESARQLRGSDAALSGRLVAADADGEPGGQRRHPEPGQTTRRRAPAIDCGCDRAPWGRYEPAIHRWESIVGRPAPSPVNERGRLAPEFVEFLMGIPAGFVTAVPGLSRSAQFRILGNGVVPQQAVAALALLLDRMEAAA